MYISHNEFVVTYVGFRCSCSIMHNDTALLLILCCVFPTCLISTASPVLAMARLCRTLHFAVLELCFEFSCNSNAQDWFACAFSVWGSSAKVASGAWESGCKWIALLLARGECKGTLTSCFLIFTACTAFLASRDYVDSTVDPHFVIRTLFKRVHVNMEEQ